MSIITTDTCEDVTICDPNVITLFCTPDGVLSKTQLSPVFSHWQYLINEAEGFYGSFDVDLYIDSAKYGQYYLFSAVGTDEDDIISGFDLLSGVDAGLQDTSAYPASTYSGNAAFFSLSGGLGDDLIVGAMNADVLDGGAGNDAIGGAGGSDSILGGTGDDVILADGLYDLENPLYIHNPFNPGWNDNVGASNDMVDAGDGNDVVYGGGGDDNLVHGAGHDDGYGGDGNDNLYGNTGNDTLSGNAGNDWLHGGQNDDLMFGDGETRDPGDDCMNGGSGNDTMYGDNGSKYHSVDDQEWGQEGGNDRMLGGSGDDNMHGEGGDDMVGGEAGNDDIYGGSGDDLLDGGADDDEVYGGYGDDIVRGGTGEDYVEGGYGCDVFAFCDVSLECVDVIGDFNTGREADRIDLSHVRGLDSIRVELTGDDSTIRLDLIIDGEPVQSIFVEAWDSDTNLSRVFENDTAYGTDVANYVQVAEGVLVDLPSTSVIFGESGLFF